MLSPTLALVSPQPMEVTRMNFLTPFLAAASMMLMLPCEVECARWSV
jgi:hypothetical protein